MATYRQRQAFAVPMELSSRAPDLLALDRLTMRDWLLAQLVAFIQLLRVQNIRKPPSIAESVDWARTLLLLHAGVLDEAMVRVL